MSFYKLDAKVDNYKNDITKKIKETCLMENKKKVSKHFLADRIPLILSAVLMLAGAFLPNMIISSIIEPFYNESKALLCRSFGASVWSYFPSSV